jgi:hypothetical protein
MTYALASLAMIALIAISMFNFFTANDLRSNIIKNNIPLSSIVKSKSWVPMYRIGAIFGTFIGSFGLYIVLTNWIPGLIAFRLLTIEQ